MRFWKIALSMLLWAITRAALYAASPSIRLDIQNYAGLTVTGATGSVYSVEYVSDLSQTNNPNASRCLEFLKLPANPYLWTDRTAATNTRRFYRATIFAPPTNMVFIPPGTFRMGSPSNEVGRFEAEGPQMDVIINRGYWMGA